MSARWEGIHEGNLSTEWWYPSGHIGTDKVDALDHLNAWRMPSIHTPALVTSTGPGLYGNGGVIAKAEDDGFHAVMESMTLYNSMKNIAKFVEITNHSAGPIQIIIRSDKGEESNTGDYTTVNIPDIGKGNNALTIKEERHLPEYTDRLVKLGLLTIEPLLTK